MTDLRFGLRMLARNPGSTALIVALLALGTGASAAIFSLFDAVLLRPLPVRRPEQLVRMVQQLPKLGARSNFPYKYYEALHDRATTLVTFGETGEYMHFRMIAPGPAEEVTVLAVTSDFFDGLGVRPLYGRVLQADDATQKFGTPPAVLSYNFWRRRLGGDPQVVRGQTLAVNGHRFSIIGVMPRDFKGLSVDTAPDLRIPLSAFPLLVDFKIESTFFELAGRLKPGITRSRAEAECLALWQSSMNDYYLTVEKNSPEEISALLRRGMKLEPLERGVSILRDRVGDVLKLLMASVTLLALIACLNVAGLLIARTAARQQEIAIRLAIGATRLRIARQMIIEGLLLAILGAAGGLLIALIAAPLAVRLLPPIRDLGTALVPLSINVGINGRGSLVLLALSTLTTLIFAVSPALTASRLGLESVLRAVRTGGGLRGRQILIASQIALCTFLLVGASLFVRSFQQLRDLNPGFERDYVATFTADIGGYTGAPAYFAALIERVRQLPGVVSVATSSTGVMRGHGVSATVAPAGERINRADFMNANLNRVSPEYFNTMGMKILVGRDFAATDVPGSDHRLPVRAIVNQSFARRLFPNASPLGKRFGTGMEGSVASGNYEIVGVINDARFRSLREPVRPMFYTVLTDVDSFVLNVRSTAPGTIINSVRRVASSIAPELPFLEVNTLAEQVEESTAPERMTAALASLFGGIATLLAGAGIYGLLAYLVMQRRREIGIRMALGAYPIHVATLIARQTLVFTLCGIVIGLGAAALAGSAIRPLLYGVAPQDPKSFVISALFVALMVALATVVPALDAAQTDPAETLRAEN